MNDIVMGPISFVAIFRSAVLGIFAERALPEDHLIDETRTTVSVSAAVVGTLSALVLDLMISTAFEHLGHGRVLVPVEGVEPPTFALRMRCSTN